MLNAFIRHHSLACIVNSTCLPTCLFSFDHSIYPTKAIFQLQSLLQPSAEIRMAYGLGDNTSGSNNIPLGARRRMVNTTSRSDRGNGEHAKIKIEPAVREMEIRTKPGSIPLATLMDESEDEPRFKRGRSTQRGL